MATGCEVKPEGLGRPQAGGGVGTLKSTFSRWLKARQAFAAALSEGRGDSYDRLTADIHCRIIGKLKDIIPYGEW